MRLRRNRERGSAMLEFTLVGIPLIFVLISLFEMSRWMWNYHTMAYAVREGTRFAIVKGVNCTSGTNACGVTIGNVAARIQAMAVGLDPALLNVTFTAGGTASATKPLSQWLNDGASWPPAGLNAPGVSIRVDARYPFQSAIAMFWPGATTGPGQGFAILNLPASAQETIQF
jgi:Flp pilus assembly protein TadG